MSTTDITSLPFDDTADFDAAERGFIAAGEGVITDEQGEVVWDNKSYTDFSRVTRPTPSLGSCGRCSTPSQWCSPARTSGLRGGATTLRWSTRARAATSGCTRCVAPSMRSASPMAA